MRHLLNAHPYGMFASYLWRKYRGTERAIVVRDDNRLTAPSVVDSDPRTFSIADSSFRTVSYPGGTGLQIINAEPDGEPCISLHQNHYNLRRDTSLGSLNFSSRDNMGASMQVTVDGEWTSVSRPTAFSLHLTSKDFATPRYRALMINSSGSVSFGDKIIDNDLVSLGIYRPGALQLPRIENMATLGVVPPLDGLILYVVDKGKIVISEGGVWKSLTSEIVV